ncbi:MAG: prolyl oligopeptidase family serine peptidase [Blastocatellia bacterium]
MNDRKIAPYGSWRSPITSDLIVAGTIGLGQAAFDGRDLYWVESRPTEKGRSVLVRRTPDGATSDVTPAPYNVRTRVHEYGGGSFAFASGGVLFSNFTDQRLYRQMPGEAPRPITPEAELRYADGVFDSRRGRLICVREDHTVPGREAVNTIAAVGLGEGAEQQTLAEGADFFASPRLSPDGTRLVWIQWNHPNMPWDGTELWEADLFPDGAPGERRRIAGGVSESIFQPEWSPDGVLHFVSDRTGWWNLYRAIDGRIEALCPMNAEFGQPLWVFGISTYAFESPSRIVCAYAENGYSRLAVLDTGTGVLRRIETPYTFIDGICAAEGSVVFTTASPTESLSIVRFEISTGAFEPIRRSSDAAVDPAFVSIPRAIEYPTENGLTAHAFFYPPVNRDYAAPEGERPPLLVKIHGGPTSATSATLRLTNQYWTSRGIAVLDVNYGGSSGYGRAYRDRLKGAWGVVDVDDCVNGAKFLVEQGLVDGDRLAITGGSAGGYTVLCALVFRDLFKAGASHFGVSDLIALDEDTHKFESRYTLGLVGESRDLYIERSPIHHTDRLNAPVIFFQGLEDRIVPPNQSERMVDALRAKGLPVAYVTFEGEQHGFRQAANIKRALDGEFYFYSRIFGFDLADPVEPVPIENLR